MVIIEGFGGTFIAALPAFYERVYVGHPKIASKQLSKKVGSRKEEVKTTPYLEKRKLFAPLLTGLPIWQIK
jgi:hypothetical protein